MKVLPVSSAYVKKTEIITERQTTVTRNPYRLGNIPRKAHQFKTSAESVSRGKVVLATVKGDIHDIGKNIVKLLLENYGFDVIDLGKDVPPETVAETAEKSGARLVGLSALMTTTLGAMEETIRLLKMRGVNCATVVGGAVLTPEYAKKIGADYYARDAKESVDIAKRVYG